MKILLLRAVLFVVLFFFAFICLLAALDAHKKGEQVKTWWKLNATVATVSIAEELRNKGMTYCPSVNVTFELNGQQHTSPLEVSSSPCGTSLESVERSIATFRQGKVIGILVDPAKPDSVKPGTFSLDGVFYFCIIMGALAAVGAVAVLRWPRSKPVRPTPEKHLSPVAMSKKEIQQSVRKLLDAGTAKSQVFAQLSGQGVKDSQLAYFIASYADPVRCDEHDRKVNILITIMLVQALLGLIAGLEGGGQIGSTAKWVVAVSSLLIPLLLVWGFYNHRAGAYNAYILLALAQLPKSLAGFASDPATTTGVMAISIALLAFVWYVRGKIFPDFAFVGPRKVNGKYLFTG